ncbi:MAG TPA: hypothetical protein VI997_03745, partial [Candidatus Thermoplasmatota archaeon]|nr:hypothetical protein [Candidatus Thermoplasmatota archaeon]
MLRSTIVIVALCAAALVAAAVAWVYFAPAGEQHVAEDVAQGEVLARGNFTGADSLHEVSGSVALVATEGG